MPMPLTSSVTNDDQHEDERQRVGNSSRHGKQLGQVLHAVDRLRTMPRLQHALDGRGRRDHILRSGHGKIDLIHRCRRHEEAADRVRNQHGVFLNFRLPEGVHAFLEHAHDRERKTAAQLDDLADRTGARTVEFLRQLLGDHARLCCGRRSLRNRRSVRQELSDCARADTRGRRRGPGCRFACPPPTLMRSSKRHGGRRGHDAGDLLAHRLHILHGHGVGRRVDALRSALVVGINHVGADGLQLAQDVLLSR